MARKLLELLVLTEDEEYLVEMRIAEFVRYKLEELKLNTYNGIYAISLTIQEVDRGTVPLSE